MQFLRNRCQCQPDEGLESGRVLIPGYGGLYEHNVQNGPTILNAPMTDCFRRHAWWLYDAWHSRCPLRVDASKCVDVPQRLPYAGSSGTAQPPNYTYAYAAVATKISVLVAPFQQSIATTISTLHLPHNKLAT
jgi:hypothetical protein